MNCCYTDLELNRCQFKESQSYKCDEKQWCIYHLPLQDKSGSKTKKGHYTKKDVGQFNETIFRLIDEAKNRQKALRLNGVVFPGIIDFSNREFPEIFFNEAIFCGGADFTGATFIEDAIFNQAIFYDKTWFEAAKLNIAMFGGTTFIDDARFKDTSCNDVLVFKDSNFFGDAIFDGGDNYNDFKGDTNFSNVHFKSAASFKNRVFRQSTTFKDAIFDRAPVFHNSILHQDTDFSGTQFKDRSVDSERAYRTLKLEMEKHGAMKEQARFFVLEEEAKRKRKDTPRSEKIASNLYEMIADYGRSFLRPLGWLIFFNIVIALSYLQIFNKSPLSIINFLIYQIVRPFSIWSYAKDPSNPSLLDQLGEIGLFGIQLLASFQTIISFTLIVLFFLALRWRFKRG